MNIFLKAKAWPLFVIFMIPAVVLMYVSMKETFSMMDFDNPQPVDQNLLQLKLYPFRSLGFVSSIISLGWMFAVGTELQKRLSAELQSNTGLFKIFMLVMMVFVTINSLILPIVLSPTVGQYSLIQKISYAFYLVYLYPIYFVGRVIRTQELQRKPEFSECIANFFLVMFFFVGVWFLQPIVNRAVENKDTI